MADCCCECVTCGVEEVVVKSGWLNNNGTKLVGGGRTIKLPFCQIIQRLSLKNMTLGIMSDRIISSEGVPISIQGTALVKIYNGNDSGEGVSEAEALSRLERACQHFLGMPENVIMQIAVDTMEGHQRGIIGAMTVLEIIQDREKFAHAVENTAREDLAMLGLRLVSYTLKDVSDPVGYLAAWGVKKNERVLAEAQIGEAEKQRDASIKEATTQQATRSSQFENQITMDRSERDRKIKEYGYQIETNTKQAEADLAYKLQEAKTNQLMMAERMQVHVVAKQQQTRVQDQDILRQERILDSTIKKPATADAYKTVVDSEGKATQVVYEAEAEAATIQQMGLANANAIKLKGTAEGHAMEKRAKEMSALTGEAIIEMVAKTVPLIAKEISDPLSKANKVTIVSGPGGDAGVTRLTGEVLNIMTHIPELMKEMSGYDLIGSIEQQTASVNDGSRDAGGLYQRSETF